MSTSDSSGIEMDDWFKMSKKWKPVNFCEFLWNFSVFQYLIIEFREIKFYDIPAPPKFREIEIVFTFEIFHFDEKLISLFQ